MRKEPQTPSWALKLTTKWWELKYDKGKHDTIQQAKSEVKEIRLCLLSSSPHGVWNVLPDYPKQSDQTMHGSSRASDGLSLKPSKVWTEPVCEHVCNCSRVLWKRHHESWTLCVRQPCQRANYMHFSKLSSPAVRVGGPISWLTYSTHLWSQQILPLVGHTTLFYFKAVPFLHKVDRNAQSNSFLFVWDSICTVEFSSLCKRLWECQNNLLTKLVI